MFTGPAAIQTPSLRRARAARIPAFQEGFVHRPELVARLTLASNASLALILAPAGYGKTTLLAEWSAHDARPFVWVTLGRGDVDELAIDDAIDWAFKDSGTSGEEAYVLILDDAHAAAPHALREVAMRRLAQLRDGSQLAISSRTEPPLPTGRLRAHRALVEVRAGDLAMAPAHAATLLRHAGLELEFGAVQALSRRTEGWPVGLYLAALSLRDDEDPAASVKQFGGDDELVTDYFRDESLTELDPELESFVLRTAVLGELSGPLCDAVLERSGSSTVLEALASSDLMLVALDHKRERFRWHRLFRETLGANLHRADPDLERHLRSRASAWLAAHGDLDGAIDQAVAAGDAIGAGALLWPNVRYYVARGRQHTLDGWLARFTAEEISNCASLGMVAAFSALFAGKLDEARHWGAVALDGEQRNARAHPTPSIETGRSILAAVAAESGPAQMAWDARHAADLEPEHSAWQPISRLLAGTAELLAGRFDLARPTLEEGVRRACADAPGTAALCLAQLAVVTIEAGDHAAAAELADRAMTLVEDPLLAAAPSSALVFATAAATQARQGRVDESKRSLRHASSLLAAFGDAIPWYGAEARIVLARAALGLADSVRARALLAEASRLARRTPDVTIFQRWLDEAWAEVDSLAESVLAGPSSLTIAELRILRFLPTHRSFREIAERLDVSVNTVKTQAHAIYRKLDAASRSEAVARASEAGLLG
jgi:LuxR family maltose regulon positive regulatory protein